MNAALFDITSADAWLFGARLVGMIAIAYIALIWIAMVAWTYRDISARTSDTTTRAVSVALVALLFAPGLLLYFAMRPSETMADAYARRLEAEAFASEIEKVQTCPSCRRAVGDDFLLCPYCRAQLRSACDDCGRSLANDWNGCPFCGAARRQPAYIPQTRPAAAIGTRPATPAAPRPRPVQSHT